MTISPSRSVRRVAAAVAVAVLLVSCSDDGDDASDEASIESTTTAADTAAPETSNATDATTTPSETDGGNAAGTTVPARPGVDTCTLIPEAPDGFYTVADVGTAVVQRDGDRLTVGEVVPAEGWTPNVDIDDDGDVDVEYRMGQLEVYLEVELDNGRLEVEICADDD